MTDSRQPKSLVENLAGEPYRFEFYQAVRLLETLNRTRLTLTAEETVSSRHVVRFRSRISFAFPASEVQDLELVGNWPQLTVNVFGLAGALGPLPPPYTEMVLDAVARKEYAAIDFLDIFNHRLIELLYNVRRAHEPALTANAPHKGPAADYLFSIIGLGVSKTRTKLGFPAQSMLYYGGLLARQPRTAAGLEVLLRDYFAIPLTVQQFSGIWRQIDRSQWTTLGRLGQNQTLADSAMLGTRGWDQAGAILIIIGPLALRWFEDFLPGTKIHFVLCSLVKFYIGAQRKARVRLRLKPGDVPQLQLGRSQLGYTSWLRARPYTQPEAFANFRLES